MKATSILALTILFGLSVSGQEGAIDFNQLVNKTHTERTLALFDYHEKFVHDEDSLTVFKDVELARWLAEKHNDLDLALEADLIELHYFTYRSKGRLDEWAEMALALIRKARDAKALWLEARCESLLGIHLYNYGQYESGMLHMRNAVRLLDDKDAAEYPIKSIVLTLLGKMHYDFREYEEAVRTYQKAFACMTTHYRKYYRMHAINTMGITYRDMGKLDSSNIWFQRVLDIAIADNDSLYIKLSQGNLGENYYLLGDFEMAEPLMLQDLILARAKAEENPGHLSNCLYILGDIALEQGDLKKAEPMMTEALEMGHRSKQARRLQPVYTKMAKLFAAKRMPDLVLTYMDSALQANQQLDVEFDRLISARVSQQLELEHIATETAKLEGERKLQLLIRNVLITIMVLVLIGLVWLFNRHRKKLQQRQQVILGEKKMAEDALRAASQRLDEIVSNMQLKNLELDQTRQELETLKDEAPDRMKEQKLRLEAAVILTDQDWRNFMELFEVVNPGFLQRLNEQYPELTLSQVRFFVLCRLERSNKEMAAMLGVTTDAIRQMRSRLRKQLSLSSEETIMALALAI